MCMLIGAASDLADLTCRAGMHIGTEDGRFRVKIFPLGFCRAPGYPNALILNHPP